MQTFLPVVTEDYSYIAKVLDRARLNKQALEGWQIMMTLLELDPNGEHRKPRGWVNHPAVKMWRGSEFELWKYVCAMTNEWIKRGYKTTIGDKATDTLTRAINLGLIPDIEAKPTWMLDNAKYLDIAKSHRIALLAKDYEWYSQFGWIEDTGIKPETYEYVWG